MRKQFKVGDPFFDVVTADYLNSIEARLNQTNKSPSGYTTNVNGRNLQAAGYTRPNWFIGILMEDLFQNSTAKARVRKRTTASGDQTESTDDFEELVVEDIFSIRSCEDDLGFIFEHPRSKEVLWIWVPFPVRPGSAIANYDSTKRQVLSHNPDTGCLEWLDTHNC